MILISIEPPPFNLEKHHTLLSDGRPRSAPALELLSRATSSVRVCTVTAIPTQGAIPEEGGYKKNCESEYGKNVTTDEHAISKCVVFKHSEFARSNEIL